MRRDKEAKEAATKASKKKNKKQELEDEMDRAQLWQALVQTDVSTREKLESLYWEQVSCLLSYLLFRCSPFLSASVPPITVTSFSSVIV